MSHVPAADHTLAILALLGRQASPLPAGTIAGRLGLPRSTVYHLLSVLREHGFVVHLEQERRYGLGVAAFELGSAYARQAPLQRLARPVLIRLVDSVKQSGHVAVLHGRDTLYVLEERAPGRPSLVTDVGVRLPSTLTASGLAMLAHLPSAQIRALFPDAGAFVQRHGVGPTSLSQLRRELQAVRARGHAIEEGTVTPGLRSVAAAAFDHAGNPVASFAVTWPGPDAAAPPASVEDEAVARAVCEAADTLTRRLRGGARA